MVGLGFEFESLASRRSTHCHVIAVFLILMLMNMSGLFLCGDMGERGADKRRLG